MERARIVTAFRTAVLLKHRLVAQEEINAKLPDLLNEFDLAVVEGRPFELGAGAIFEDVEATKHIGALKRVSR